MGESGDFRDEYYKHLDTNKNAVLSAKKVNGASAGASARQQENGHMHSPEENGVLEENEGLRQVESSFLSLDLDVDEVEAEEMVEGAEASPQNGTSDGYNGSPACSTPMKTVSKFMDYNFTPINSPQQDDSFMCASRFNSLEEGNGHAIDGMRPEAHPYLDWDELFALTDYVQMGCYKPNAGKKHTHHPSSHDDHERLKVPEVKERNGETDDHSTASRSDSDLFDVFINPVHHSASDESHETDEIISTGSTSASSLSLYSETDSDTTSTSSNSRPYKSSLRDPKRPKTPPGTPSKKSVRFADALGLDLETVRHILDQDSCYSPPVPHFSLDGVSQRIFKPILRMCFDQPGGCTDFLKRVYERNICLENVVVHDMTVMGTIKVRNLAFQKEVRVRYSWDNWSSHANILAMYVAGSCDGPTDRFTFGFTVPRRYTGLGDRVFLAVYFMVDGQEFWDNNDGYNYLLLVEEEVKVLKGR